MPTYEYRCPEGHDFEQFTLKISAAATELPCPTCGKVAPRRMSAGGGLLFKGSGFYITDYGKDGKKDQRAASKPSDSASSSAKSEGKSSGGSDGSSGSSSAGSSGGASGSSGSSSPSSSAPAKPSSGE